MINVIFGRILWGCLPLLVWLSSCTFWTFLYQCFFLFLLHHVVHSLRVHLECQSLMHLPGQHMTHIVSTPVHSSYKSITCRSNCMFPCKGYNITRSVLHITILLLFLKTCFTGSGHTSDFQVNTLRQTESAQICELSLVFCVALVAGELGMCLKMEPAYVWTCYGYEPRLLSYSCKSSNLMF